MIATYSLKSLSGIIFKGNSCNSRNCLHCISLCQRLLLSNNCRRIVYARNLCIDRNESQKLRELDSNEDDEFGNLKEPLEKTYRSTNSQKFNKIHNLHLASASLKENNDQHTCHSSLFDLKDESDMEQESDDEEAVSYEKKPVRQYFLEMKECDEKRNLKGALALYSDMKQSKVFPQKFIYTFLIGACGRAGYTKAAFKLFKEMRDRHMQPSVATLTGLFNACAESPYPKYGLEKAHQLRNKMIENAWLPSTITYNAMVKAFGRCGDMKTAFQIADEMTEAKYPLTSETFCFLLMSCISDKEAGFTHAVQVFRKMKKFRVPLTTFHYNLLLRATRECGTGPPEIASQLLFDWYVTKPGPVADNSASLKITGNSNRVDKYLENVMKDKVEEMKIAEHSDSSPKSLSTLRIDTKKQLISQSQSAFNVLASHSFPRNEVIGIENVNTADNRLLLIGGVNGLLSNMKLEKVKPDIKTITIMLDCIPSTYESEQLLLSAMVKYDVKPDIDFFNLIIKRRNIRNDYTAGLEILQLLPQYGLSVDIATYGVLALGCGRTFAMRLLNDMKAAGFQPNIEIVGALMSNASVRKDFRYIIDMMNATKELGIKPDPKMLQDLEKARRNATNLLKDSKKHINPETLKWCRIFCMQYKPWLQSIDVEIPEHPWKQFRISNDKI